MALEGVELQTLSSEPDALTTRSPPCFVELTGVSFTLAVATKKV